MRRGAGVRRTAEAKVRPQLDHDPGNRLALPLWRDIGLYRIHVDGNEHGIRRRRGRPIFQGRHAECRSASRNIVPMCDLCNRGSGHLNRHDNLELLLIAPSTRPFPPKYFNTSQIHLGHALTASQHVSKAITAMAGWRQPTGGNVCNQSAETLQQPNPLAPLHLAGYYRSCKTVTT